MIKREVPKLAILFILISTLFPAPLQAETSRALTTAEALSKTGTSLRWDPFFQSGVLVSGDHQISFQAGNPGESSLVIVDGKDLLHLPNPYLEGGALLFPEVFVNQITLALDNSKIYDQTRLRIAAIIVDPGHGGKDSGAVGTHTISGKQIKVVEKDIALKVSKDLSARLSASYPDKRIIMTRTDDTYPTLEKRVAEAHSVPLKDNEAIVFVSIHANASFNKNARGYEVWYLSPEYRRTVIDKDKYGESTDVVDILNLMMEEEFTTESIMIARSIMNQFDHTIGKYGPSRGIKAEEWFVVRNARMPSVLVELGFVSNPEDAKLMSDPEYLKKLSDALYKGIVDFVTKFEQSGGFTQIQ